jgi:ribosome-binding protein aMBF1 (putative translation factor)
MNNCYQDWEPVVIPQQRRKRNSISPRNLWGNKEFKRLDSEEIPKLNKITREQSQAISTARNACNLSQKDLAQKLNITENIIR